MIYYNIVNLSMFCREEAPVIESHLLGFNGYHLPCDLNSIKYINDLFLFRVTCHFLGILLRRYVAQITRI